MMTSIAEAQSRIVRVGALISLLGALHTLTLLLGWFAVTYDSLQSQVLVGYGLNEGFLLSLVAGGLAGAAGALSALMRSFSRLRVLVPAIAASSGALATLSPIYLFMVKMPRLGIAFTLEIGLFAAIFSGVAILGIGVLASMIGLRAKTEYVPAAWQSYPRYQEPLIEQSVSMTMEQPEEFFVTEEPAAAEQTSAPGTARSYGPVEETPSGGQCSICYDELIPGATMSCSSCGALFHKDCVETLAELGGKCPTCGASLQG